MQPGSIQRHPDPFGLPSETGLALISLVVALVASSLVAHELLYYVVDGSDFLADSLRCNELPGSSPEYSACLVEARANLRSWLYVGLAVVAVVVLVYFWSYPARKRRRDGSLALSHASGGVQSAAEQCADE